MVIHTFYWHFLKCRENIPLWKFLGLWGCRTILPMLGWSRNQSRSNPFNRIYFLYSIGLFTSDAMFRLLPEQLRLEWNVQTNENFQKGESWHGKRFRWRFYPWRPVKLSPWWSIKIYLKYFWIRDFEKANCMKNSLFKGLYRIVYTA